LEAYLYELAMYLEEEVKQYMQYDYVHDSTVLHERSLAERSKSWIQIKKVILLKYQNNYVERSN